MSQSIQSSSTAGESIWSNGDAPLISHISAFRVSLTCLLKCHTMPFGGFQRSWKISKCQTLACILCRLWKVVNKTELARSPLLLSFLELSEAVRVIPQQQPSPSCKSITAAKPVVVRFSSSCSCCGARPHACITVCLTNLSREKRT